MENYKKARTAIRTAFSKTLTTLQGALSQEHPVIDNVQVSFLILSTKMKELEEYDKNIFEKLITEETTVEDIAKECDTADEYKSKFLMAKCAVERLVKPPPQPNITTHPPQQDQRTSQRSLKLPKIELPKFSGEIKDWLLFWSQFKKIHENDTINCDDKFQYLIQAMEAKSKASELVNSFPPTADNYEKVIKCLTNRFGKEELLVEVYVRELLKIILNKALKPSAKSQLDSLYDKLESHLRALETLGVTSDKCAAMLYPLVESALPEELLRAWQRHTDAPGVAGDLAPKNRLTRLMDFMQREVENEQRIELAIKGFGLDKDQEKPKKKIKGESNDIATATGLLTIKDNLKQECLFCSEKHQSSTCEKARRLTLEERQNWVKEKNACFSCLKLGHSSKRCMNKLKCPWCGRRHTLLMCRDMSAASSDSKLSTLTGSSNNLKSEHEPIKNQQSLANVSLNQEVFLQTLRVKLIHNKKEQIVRVVLDSGSHRSYILEQVARGMGYESVGQQRMIHLLFGGSQTRPQEHQGYRIHLRSLDDKYDCDFVALDQQVICSQVPSVNNGPWLQELKKQNVNLSDVGYAEHPIAILIGADVMGKLLTGIQFDLECGPTAVQTRLGWTLIGKKPSKPHVHNDAVLMVTTLFTKEADVSDLWRLDVLGINDPEQKKSNEEHQREVNKKFRQTVGITQEGRYEVCLPWRENHPPLLDNRSSVLRRLQSTTRNLREENLFDVYDKILQEWLCEGIVETVPEDEIHKDGRYLPHRYVLKQSSTTPVRPVFDASARTANSPSLNQCLETGPNLIELIPAVLLRFREKPIGVSSDIKKAFLQISIAQEDRDVLRFLWWDKDRPDNLQVLRHTRVVFGVSSSPYLLGATIEMHLQQALERAATPKEKAIILQLMKSFYIDNCVTSVEDLSELTQFRETATALLATAKFDLRGWEHTGQIGGVPNDETSVLGLTWNKQDDTLMLSRTALEVEPPVCITKRTILSAAQKIYDPIGFVCPVMLNPKLLLQGIWMSALDWDTVVNDQTKKIFIDWLNELHRLKEIQIPRWIFDVDRRKDSLTFHVFVDASQSAYAAVIFARTETANDIKIQLVLAKARVAPTNKTTIPRLELLAATVGARLMNSTSQTLKYDGYDVYYWSDSTTVLTWIHRENQCATFVWNRIQEIRQLTDPQQWRHVPGALNPADLPSRGCTAKQLIASRWWEGPEWLKATPEHWPSKNYVAKEEEVVQETRKIKKTAKVDDTSSKDVAMSNVCKDDRSWHTQYFSKYSEYSRILRITGWIYRFINNSRLPITMRQSRDLTNKELVESENNILRIVQGDSFEGSEDSRLSTLNAFTDKKGLIRLRTLASNRKDKHDFKYPIVLDPGHSVVLKLIRHEHLRKRHAAIHILLNSLRERYWILSGRKTVRHIVNKCVICKRYKTTRLEAIPAVLPEDRVRDAATFEVAGVDFAGPVYLRDEKKAWICLFTCAVYRAIHLELVTSLSTEGFLEALRRFVARRGRPAKIYSDNGTNFVAANNLFQKLDWNKIRRHSTAERIEWHFNPPLASRWGGWWERLIRIVKDMLKRILKKACVTYEEMCTILCDCEAIIDTRPITYLSDDVSQPLPLTPEMFLKDLRESGVPDIDQIHQRQNGSELQKRLRYRQTLKESLRKRFRSEYLGQLTRRVHPKKEHRSLRVGDVVLVGNDNQKRLDWPLAVIIELITGRDGHVRVARVKTSNNTCTRPIQRLYPLEMSQDACIAETLKRKSTKREHERTHKASEGTCKPTDIEGTSGPTTTRSGRFVKPPNRLEL